MSNRALIRLNLMIWTAVFSMAAIIVVLSVHGNDIGRGLFR